MGDRGRGGSSARTGGSHSLVLWREKQAFFHVNLFYHVTCFFVFSRDMLIFFKRHALFEALYENSFFREFVRLDMPKLTYSQKLLA